MRFALCLALLSFFALRGQLSYSLYVPQGSAAKPLLVMLHGFGANESDLLELGKRVAPGATVLSLRAPKALGDNRFAWFPLERVNGALTYNYGDAVKAAEAVKAFVMSEARRLHADTAQIFLLGFSQGAMLTMEIVSRYPGFAKGGVVLSGRLMSETESRGLRCKGTALFIAHGKRDELLPSSGASHAADVFRHAGCDTELRQYDVGHSIAPDEVSDIRAWLAAKMNTRR